MSLLCWVSWQENQVLGKTIDIAYGGVGVLLPEAIELTEEARIQIPEGIWLRVRPIHIQQENSEEYRVGCKIERIERGEDRWRQLCYVPRW